MQKKNKCKILLLRNKSKFLHLKEKEKSKDYSKESMKTKQETGKDSLIRPLYLEKELVLVVRAREVLVQDTRGGVREVVLVAYRQIHC